MTERVLCVAAHPDDEVLFAGGTMARHADAGDVVRSFILAEGATSRGAKRVEVDALREAAAISAKILGIDSLDFGGLPDQRLDDMPLLDVIKLIEAQVTQFQPTVVYTHHGGDLNLDHQIVHRAVITACRPLPGNSLKAVYAGETLSSTEWAAPSTCQGFVPQHFVTIENSLARKLEALRAYQAEMRAFPHPRSIEAVEALARVRGATIGVTAAEAFMVERSIR